MVHPNCVNFQHHKTSPCFSPSMFLSPRPGGCVLVVCLCCTGFPGGWIHLQCRRPGSYPWVRRCPGEENDNPLQCSCLGNPMDRGAWWATVHGVAKSQTQLTNTSNEFPLNSSSSFCSLPPTHWTASNMHGIRPGNENHSDLFQAWCDITVYLSSKSLTTPCPHHFSSFLALGNQPMATWETLTPYKVISESQDCSCRTPTPEDILTEVTKKEKNHVGVRIKVFRKFLGTSLGKLSH